MQLSYAGKKLLINTVSVNASICGAVSFASAAEPFIIVQVHLKLKLKKELLKALKVLLKRWYIMEGMMLISKRNS